MVEWQHHRHLVHEARETIRHEMEENSKTAAQDLQWLHEDEQRVADDIKILLTIRAGKKVQNETLHYTESWNSLNDAAWQTAHSTGAMNYIDYAEAQAMADIYGQQAIAQAEGLDIYRAHTLAIAPLFIENNPDLMTKDEVQLTLQRSADLLMRLRSLQQIMGQLQQGYAEELKRLH